MKRIGLAILLLITLLLVVVALAESRVITNSGYTITGITLDDSPASNTFVNPNADILLIGIRAWCCSGQLQASSSNSCTTGDCDNAGGAQLSPVLPPVYYTSRHYWQEGSSLYNTFYTSVGGGASSETCYNGGC
jgi:hypothetical protein